MKGVGFLGYVGMYCIIEIRISRVGNIIDRILYSGISFRLLQDKCRWNNKWS